MEPYKFKTLIYIGYCLKSGEIDFLHTPFENAKLPVEDLLDIARTLRVLAQDYEEMAKKKPERES
jgi:hypothetical protein